MNMKMSGSYVGSVVLSGICIVFVALILLIFFVWLMDKVFKALGEGKKKSAPEVKKEDPAVSVPVQKASEPPAVSDGISDEVVAVITAAVAAMSAESGVKLGIRSIKRSTGSRRGAWGNASAAEGTRSSFDIF